MHTEVAVRGRVQRPVRQEVWARFVELHASQVRAAVRQTARAAGMARIGEEVEDLTQEVYYRLLQRGGGEVPELGAAGQRFAYLRRVARSVIIDRRRAGGAKKRGGGRLTLSWEQGRTARRHDAIDTSATPEERLLLRERRRALVRRCRRILAGRHAARNLEIVHLAWVEGWNSREISQRLAGELTPSSIDTLLCRIRRRLLEEESSAAGRTVRLSPRACQASATGAALESAHTAPEGRPRVR